MKTRKAPKYIKVYKNHTDEELAYLAREDELAFAALYYRTHKQILKALRGSRLPRDEHPDFAQRVWIRVLNNLHNYDSTRKFVPWVCVIARNMVTNYWRDVRRTPIMSANHLGYDLQTGEEIFLYLADKEALTPAEEDSVHYRNLLDKVDAHLQRDLTGNEELRLFMQSKSYLEIAAQRGLKVGTVKSRIARAREVLQRAVA